MLNLLLSGGPIMIPIGICSVVALAVFIERCWQLRRSHVLPESLRIELNELAQQGRWDDALVACKKSDSAVSRVLLAMLDHRKHSRAVLREVAEEAGRREAVEMERYTGIVGVIAAIAPLLGLLGTVWGMIDTFDVIQQQGLGVVSSLAGGISTALVTTFGGLCVGIPALVSHRYLLAMVDERVRELEEVSSRLLGQLQPWDAP